MPKVKTLRFILFIAVALVHLLVILLVAFRVGIAGEEEPPATVMKLVDLREEPPPPPPAAPRPPSPLHNTTEAVAQSMIETDEPPPTEIYTDSPAPAVEIEYLPMHKISGLPSFDEKELRDALVYPPSPGGPTSRAWCTWNFSWTPRGRSGG